MVFTVNKTGAMSLLASAFMTAHWFFCILSKWEVFLKSFYYWSEHCYCYMWVEGKTALL